MAVCICGCWDVFEPEQSLTALLVGKEKHLPLFSWEILQNLFYSWSCLLFYWSCFEGLRIWIEGTLDFLVSVLPQSAWDLIMDKKIGAEVRAVCWNREVMKVGTG